MNEAHQRYRHFLETLTAKRLDRLAEIVDADVRFVDPFNDVRGADEMARVFQHMFDNVSDVQFSVRHMSSDGLTCLMDWHFKGRLRGSNWAFDGASVIQFGNDGRVRSHVDYWDAAQNFYERIPFIGRLLAAVRQQIAIR